MWKDSYKIGVELIDKQHRELFNTVEHLLDVMGKDDIEDRKKECMSTISFLKNYVVKHFSTEEEYQASIQYSGIEEHKKQHREFTARVLNYEQEIIKSNFDFKVIKSFIGTLTAWLIYHVADADQKITKGVQAAEKNDSMTFIEYFSSSAREVLNKYVGINTVEIVNGVQPERQELDGVCVQISLFGGKEGIVSFIYSNELAFELINRMTNIQSKERDELGTNLLKEVSNIIGSNAISKLNDNDIICSMREPILSFDYEQVKTYESVRYSTGLGNFEVQLRME